jgi:hypothetical protein
MKARSTLAITALVFVFALMFAPVAFAFHATPSRGDPAPCQITWSNPSGTYAFGALVTSAVTTQCAGVGAWQLTSQPGGATVATGSFSCVSPGCTSLTLLSTSSLAPGNYQYTGIFNGASFSFSFTVSTFIVTPQFIGGTILAILAPIGAVIGYAKLRRPKI